MMEQVFQGVVWNVAVVVSPVASSSVSATCTKSINKEFALLLSRTLGTLHACTV